MIVAEIASNWEGSLSRAEELIRESKKAGVDAVKFQMWRAEDLYKNHPLWKIIKKSELTFDKAVKLKKIADKENIEFFCSVFYPEAIDFLENLGVSRYKIASRTCILKDPYSLETLEKIAKTKKPVIFSLGMGGNQKKLYSLFSKNKKITQCYCISEYPTPFEKLNWRTAVKYDGFSDHTLGITADIIFAILKKQKNTNHIFIEKHVKLEKTKGPDASSSITTKQLAELVSNIRVIEKTNL